MNWFTACLPLVYNLVGRALDACAHVDDVVHEVLSRTLDGLGSPRDRAQVRARLVALTMDRIHDPDIGTPGARRIRGSRTNWTRHAWASHI